jgi:hypothetical protein
MVQIPSVVATCRKSGSFAGDIVHITVCYHCGKGPKLNFWPISRFNRQTRLIGKWFDVSWAFFGRGRESD